MTTESTWQHSWPGSLGIAVLLVVALALLAVGIYRREPNLPSPRWRAGLATLRVLVLWVIVWMMFGWQRQEHRTEPAELIIALDDSASMGFRHDDWEPAAAARLRRLLPGGAATPASRFEIARQLLAQPGVGWLRSLDGNYRVRLVLLADSLRELPREEWDMLDSHVPDRPKSALGAGVQAMLEAQRDRPTAAVVVLTDGVTTDGASLAELAGVARQQAIPLYPVGIGSEQPARDVGIADLVADDVAFVDDLVTVVCQLTVHGLARQKPLVRLSRTDTGETLAEQSVELPGDATRVPVRLAFRARVAGEYPLQLAVSPLEGEADLANNQAAHRLTVHDQVLRVLLVEAAPSYEFRNLRNVLTRATGPGGGKSEKAFAVDVVLQEADPAWVAQEPGALAGFPLQREELFAYDVVVLGDAEPALLGTAALTQLVEFVREQAGGVILAAGPRFQPLAYRGTPLEPLLPFDPATVGLPGGGLLERPAAIRLTPVGQLLPPCQILPEPEANARLWSELPGVYWHVTVPDPGPAARVLLECSGAGGEPRPLVLFQYFGAGRVVFHATDETYRWARHEGNDEYYERYWLQTVRYASRSRLLRDGSPAVISVERQRYSSGEDVPVQVRFRQAGLAPQAPDAVAVVIEPAVGPRRTLELTRQEGDAAIFSGAAGDLSPGEYRVWLAAPNLAPPPTARSFEVAPPVRERVQSPLDATDLEQAAQVSRGRFLRLQDADRLPQLLPQGQRVRIGTLPAEPWWNSPWIAALFLVLLTSEWVLRKRVGLV